MRDWSEGLVGVDVGTVPHYHCSAASATTATFSFKGDLANSPLLIAMPPYRQSARMGASKSRGLTFTGGVINHWCRGFDCEI